MLFRQYKYNSSTNVTSIHLIQINLLMYSYQSSYKRDMHAPGMEWHKLFYKRDLTTPWQIRLLPYLLWHKLCLGSFS